MGGDDFYKLGLVRPFCTGSPNMAAIYIICMKGMKGGDYIYIITSVFLRENI